PYHPDAALIDATRQDNKPRANVLAVDFTAVVLGRGSKPESELHVEACVTDGIPLLRRKGGGCAVVLDPGNVIVSAVLPVPGLSANREYFEKLSAWLISGLQACGIPGVIRKGRSDLAVGDRKIAGACIHRSKGLLYYAASLLVNPDVELIERYLKYPPREPDYRLGRPHAEFVGKLSDYADGIDTSTLVHGLASHLSTLP
ncbi:hypothetical protein ACFLU6_12565, partial [Acidobacteriota bacterium]